MPKLAYHLLIIAAALCFESCVWAQGWTLDEVNEIHVAGGNMSWDCAPGQNDAEPSRYGVYCIDVRGADSLTEVRTIPKQSFLGEGSVAQNTIRARVELDKDASLYGGGKLRMSVVAAKHFPKRPNLLSTLYFGAFDLNGAIWPLDSDGNVPGLNDATHSVAIYQNAPGSPDRIPKTSDYTTRCDLASPPTPCFVAIYLASYRGQKYEFYQAPPTTKIGEAAINWSTSHTFFEYSATLRQDWETTIAYGTILNSAIPVGATSVVAAFDNTSRFYLTSSDPANAMIADDGTDFGDPARNRTAITVKSSPSTPANILGNVLGPDPGKKIVGGGVKIDPETGHRLVFSRPYPNSETYLVNERPPSWSPKWEAFDILPSSSGMAGPGQQTTVTNYALQLNDPSLRYRVSVTSGLSALGFRSRPFARAIVPPGYVLAGGGCTAVPDYTTPAGSPRLVRRTLPPPSSYLVGSYPDIKQNGEQSWVCESQGQYQYNQALVAAYAVGIKDTMSDVQPTVGISKVTSPGSSAPMATADLIPGGLVISGCGARVEPNVPSSPTSPTSSSSLAPLPRAPNDNLLLTAMFPIAASPKGTATGCQANASGYGVSGQASLTAYAVNLLFDRGQLTGIDHQDHAPPGTTLTLQGTGFVDGMKMRFDCPATTVTVPVSRPGNSVHSATVVVPNAPPGFCLLTLLQGDVEVSYLNFNLDQ